MKVRESRDSVEHPTSLAIAVLFDVTGSMAEYPEIFVEHLPKLLGLIQQNGYVEHPQIMFGAIGDAHSDRVPLQVAQFESDNRMDEHLEKILLEGGGGGGNHESYELALYFMANHTSIDCFEKRGEKGYLFVLGDENSYTEVNPAQVGTIIGDTIQGPLSFADVLRDAQEKYDVYFVQPRPRNDSTPETVKFWETALGDHALYLDTGDDVCDVIGVTIGKAQALRNPLIP